MRDIEDNNQKGLLQHGADYIYRRAREGNFVSCWSLGAKDNMALWQLYGGVSTSLALTTTIEKLTKVALTWHEATIVIVNKVQYVDHSTNPDMFIGVYSDLLRYKHEAYQYENEVRVIVPRQSSDWEQNPHEIRLPIGDLNDFIRSIVLAPEAQQWFYDIVADVITKYGITAPLRRSKLAFLPGAPRSKK
jgi:hypothetical protein